MKKRTLAVLLLICLLSVSLFGCLGNETPQETTNGYEQAVRDGFAGTREEWEAVQAGHVWVGNPHVYINAAGFYVIGRTVTDVRAEGENAKNPALTATEDGFWALNGVKTNVKVERTVAPGYVQTYPYTDADGAIHIRYQDTYDFGEKIVAVLRETIESRVTGTDEKDPQLLKVRGNTVFAVATGRASVRLASGDKTVIVEPSPLNMLFVTGQSNASGDHATVAGKNGHYTDYVRIQDTMSYFTFTYQTLDITGAAQIANPNHGNALSAAQQPADYVTPTLKWGTNTRYSDNIAGPHISVFDESSEINTFKQGGWCAGLAREWVEGTGERVWVVNASHGGHPINNFIPRRMGGPELLYNDYEQAVAVFRLALNTLYNEVDAGHFTLSHMAYYWFQGESDSSSDDRYYDEQFAKVHTGMMEDVAYDHNGEYHALEFCGLMTLRSCRDNDGNSLAELYMTGPRISQYAMGAATSGVFENVYVISNVTEKWVGGDENVEDYFLSVYGSPSKFNGGRNYPMPTTMQEVHPQIHYFQQGHNEMGLDAGRNSLFLLNRKNPGAQYHLSRTEAPLTVSLLGVDGYTEIDSVTLDINRGFGYVIPCIEPVSYMQDGVELRSETEGLAFEGFRLVMTGDARPASLTVSVLVGGRVAATYTLAVRYGLSFAQARRRSHNMYGGDFNPPRTTEYDEEESNLWTAGYLTYRSGVFTPFNYVQDGWLIAASDAGRMWQSGWHGGFRNGSYVLGCSSTAGEGIGLRYVAQQDGTISFGLETMRDRGETDFAVFVNGKPVFPAGASGSELEGSVHNGWFRLRSSVTAEDISAAMAEITVSVQAGDEIVFVFEPVGGNTIPDQAMVYPVIYYVTE